MGRLIDSDNVIEVFANRLAVIVKNQLSCDTAALQKVLYITCCDMATYEIDKIPTAYDVDKVVEELEGMKDSCKKNGRIDGFIASERAIKIVRGGKNV